MQTYNFKNAHTLETRMKESLRIKCKYKDRLPLIIETKGDIKIDKSKYLVPTDLTLGQFLCLLRNRLTINENEAIFLFFNNELPIMTETLLAIYNKNKDKDGFLYGVITKESTFGYSELYSEY
jgi:GABA(A) receptor-associated protein